MKNWVKFPNYVFLVNVFPISKIIYQNFNNIFINWENSFFFCRVERLVKMLEISFNVHQVFE